MALLVAKAGTRAGGTGQYCACTTVECSVGELVRRGRCQHVLARLVPSAGADVATKHLGTLYGSAGGPDIAEKAVPFPSHQIRDTGRLSERSREAQEPKQSLLSAPGAASHDDGRPVFYTLRLPQRPLQFRAWIPERNGMVSWNVVGLSRPSLLDLVQA